MINCNITSSTSCNATFDNAIKKAKQPIVLNFSTLVNSPGDATDNAKQTAVISIRSSPQLVTSHVLDEPQSPMIWAFWEAARLLHYIKQLITRHTSVENNESNVLCWQFLPISNRFAESWNAAFQNPSLESGDRFEGNLAPCLEHVALSGKNGLTRKLQSNENEQTTTYFFPRHVVDI